MKIFIDTAKLNEIEKACSWGVVDGVTTNPSLIKKAVDALKEKGKKVEMVEYIEEICRTVGKGKPVSLEVISLKTEEMIKEGLLLYEKFNPVANNVAIKIPICTYQPEATQSHYEGLKAVSKLSSQGIPVNVTLIMAPEQAILAAKAGASYASPFAGRIDDLIRKKLGISSNKEEYFDFKLLAKIVQAKLNKHLDSSLNQQISTLYQAEQTTLDLEMTNDQGISSGVELVKQIAQIYQIYRIKTEIIAASLRNAQQVREVAQAGTDISTIPFKVIEQMLEHPKTMEGIKLFSADVVTEYRQIFAQ